MGRKPKDGMDWAKCQAQWEAGYTSGRLSKSYPVSRQAIDIMARNSGWQRRNQTAPGKLPIAIGFEGLINDTKATPEILGVILESFKSGASQNVAAAASGISHQTISNWVSNYPDFGRAVKLAQAEFIQARRADIIRASPRDWRAADRLLSVHEMTKADHGQAQGQGQVNVVININRPAIEGQPGDDARIINNEDK